MTWHNYVWQQEDINEIRNTGTVPANYHEIFHFFKWLVNLIWQIIQSPRNIQDISIAMKIWRILPFNTAMQGFKIKAYVWTAPFSINVLSQTSLNFRWFPALHLEQKDKQIHALVVQESFNLILWLFMKGIEGITRGALCDSGAAIV